MLRYVDWVQLYYVGTVVLNMSEEIFWANLFLGGAFFILSDECLELPSDSVKKGITLKRFEKQWTVSSERCRGRCISETCGACPIRNWEVRAMQIA